MSFVKKTFNSLKIWIAGHKGIAISVATSVVAVAVAVVLLICLKPAVHDPIAITAEINPTVSDSNGVYINSSFLIDGTAFTGKDQLLSQLSTNVEIPFSVEKTVEGNYLLTFKSSLAPASICNFFINDGNGNDRSYAFQTKADFGVRSFFPKNGTTVPTDTGIEIVFTNDNFIDFENYITVTPEMAYKLEKVSNRIVIIPEEKLEDDTAYTVTVKKGLANAGGEVLSQDLSATFYVSDDESTNADIYRSGDIAETFLTTDIPVIEVYTNDHSWAENKIDYSTLVFNVKVNRVPSADEYAALLKAKESRDMYAYGGYGYYDEYDAINTEGMSEVLKADIGLIPYASDSYSTSYIVLPQELPEGYYVVTASCAANGKNYTVKKLLQISDTVVYMRSNGKELFAWVNDAKSASGIENAIVTVDGGKSAKTAANGTVTVPISGEKKAATIRIDVPGRNTFVASTVLSPKGELSPSDAYHSYVYTDRESYLPTDSVKVFGVLKSRYGDELPEKLTVNIGWATYDYDYAASDSLVYMEDENVLASVEVTPDKNGVFSAELPINKYGYGYYDVAVCVDGQVVCSKGVGVEDYTKPAFTVSFDELKEYYMTGETVPFGMTAEYYGGIPAANEEFKVGDFYYSTGANGRIEVPMTANPGYATDTWHPTYNYISVEDNLTLDKINYFGKNYYCLPRDVMLTAKAESDGNGSYSVKLNTNLIDVDKANAASEKNYETYDFLKGESYDTTVYLTVESVTAPAPTEYTYYDYVAKKTVATLVYSYDYTTTFVSSAEYQTVDGEATAEFTLPELERGYYKFTVTCTDTQGRGISCTEFGREDIYDSYNETNIKEFTVSDDGEPNYAGVYGSKYIKAKKVGESISLSLVDENGTAVTEGKLLLGIVNPAVSENRLYESLSFELTFKEEYIPNIYLVGAYFDGKRIYKLSNSVIPYDFSERALDVSVSVDKEKYTPGDEMTVRVSIKDKNGVPHEGSVNISVVDEAQFAVAPQYADILSEFYSARLGNGCVSSFVSYTQHSFNGFYGTGGEGGGGGDEGVPRQNFLDTAAFETVRTDKRGNAELTLKLPDNVTDWRITVSAISDKLYGGSVTKNVSATLPFVVDAIIPKVYQEGDDISFGAHAYGTSVNGGAAVEYSAVLKKTDGSELNLNEKVSGNGFCYLNFGKLPVGEYSVTVSGSSASGNDAIEEKFTVVSNADELSIVSDFRLSDGVDIKALRSPITLVFSNANAKYVSSTLHKHYYSAGARVDQQIAAHVSGKLLNSSAKDNDGKLYHVSQISVGDWQNSDGGVAIYPYAEADPFVTSFAAWADAESFDTEALRRYFRKTDGAEKYIGLAAIGEPVLLEVRSLLSECEAEDLYSRMIYACALAAIGDDSGSEAEFELTFRSLVAQEGYSAWIECGDANENDRLTAMALCIVSRTDRELAVKFMRYLEERSLKDFYGLQKVIYARNMLYGSFGTAEFEYTDGDVKRTVTLSGTETKAFVMTVEEFEAANFTQTGGEVAVTARFSGGSDNLELSEANLKIEKNFAPLYGGTASVGDKVEVVIRIPKGGKGAVYSVSDYIPTGFRFSEFDYDASNNAWLCSQQGQRVSIYANCEKEDAYAVFYVRAVTEGNFILNGAYAVNPDGRWGMSFASSVNVG